MHVHVHVHVAITIACNCMYMYIQVMSVNSYNVLVEKVQHHVGKSRVTPVSMDQEKLLQVFEPGHVEITGQHSLHGSSSRLDQFNNQSK